MNNRLARIFASFSVLALLLALMPGQIQQASAVSPDIVISQVYGGGGNSGAPYTNDFVELFNRGTTTVNITGWSVQYASATGTGNFGGNPVTVLNGSLAPGQYYLVQLAGGSNGVALPTPDAIGTANMSGSSGKIIVSNQSSGLACNGNSTPCSSSDLALIVDLVGYGSANFYEGSGAAPGLSNTTAGFRAGNGCTDTDDNAADFSASAPNPRNTASPLNPCNGGDTAPSVTSTTPSDGATDVAIDANIEISFSEAVDVGSNWFDISCTSSGSHTASETGGPATFTLDPDSDFVNSETCTVTVYAALVTDQDTDDPPDTMNADYVFSFTTEGVVETPDIIITEIMYNPASAEDNWEWVEIYNAGSSPVDLTGFVIDDNNSVAHGSANIAGGTLAAGEQAILYNADDVLSSDFLAAWGTVNLIPVTDWSAMGLNNSGDTIGIWDSFASYSGDQATHANAIENVAYATSAPWPSSDGNASIYLTDLTVDNTDGANWALSTDGGATPLFTGYTSTAAGGNSGADVGSPGTPVVSAEVVINEFSASTTGADVEYVEIFGTPNTDFSAYTVLEIEGDSSSNMGTVDEVISLGSTDANGFYLVNLPVDSLENGTITLLLVQNFTGALGNDLDTDNDGTFDATPWASIVDAVAVNDGGAGDLTYGVPALGPNYDGLSSFAPGGASRIPDGFDTDAASDWARNDFDLIGIPGFVGTPVVGEAYNTPGESNELITIVIPPFGMCGDPATLIHDVQGDGLTSPVAGDVVVIEGVVVAAFQGPNQIGGYHVQEEDAQADADPLTSEGVYVYDNSNTVSVGDLVRVEGAVSEFNSLTELSSAVNFANCGTGSVTPATLSLPVSSVDDFEAYEGMLVTFPQALVISEYFNFDRFGEIVLTSERHLTPTAEFEPGPDSIQAAADFLLDRITLDDGRSNQNPDPAIHPNGSVFDLSNLFRGGDTVANVTGAMDYAFGLYRIQPTQGADYTSVNPRTSQPEDVGGSLKVASFNVLNYFSTIDTGAFICGPAQDLECRGADDANEFTRQRDKIIAAITVIDADVVGLLEIENNVNDDAVIDLVNGLNAVNGAGTYDYVSTGAIGTDAIKVALIYKPASVSLYGGYAVLDSTVDPRFIDTKNRPALAQTFQDNATGGVFTVTVNHLKSKGSDCNDIGDPDTGDGSGNCNGTRTLAAQALVDWLATDPTGSGDPDFLIIGDLNSYDKEDPIDAIKAGSDDTLGTSDDYTDMVFQFQGEDAYSYVFDGQIGYLDHALANANLASQITGVADWHINADEADLIDYDTTFKQPAQDAIYAPDPYRSSDHDPVIIGLNLLPPIPQCNGLDATIYVGQDGKIVGGSQDGYPYSGTLIGSSGADVIVGTESVDVVFGLNGDDVICTLGGDDRVYAGAGDDVVFSGNGDDLVYGSLGDDTAYGEGGKDAILGGAGQDVLDGGAGKDLVDGGSGADILAGGDQNDIVRGGIGNDQLDGGGGTDLCNGGPGSDIALSCEIKILIP